MKTHKEKWNPNMLSLHGKGRQPQGHWRCETLFGKLSLFGTHAHSLCFASSSSVSSSSPTSTSTPASSSRPHCERIFGSVFARLGQSTFHTKSLFNNNSVNIIGIIIVNNLTLRLLKFMFVGLTKYPPILREDIWVRFWRPWSIYLSHKSPHTFIVGLFNNNINIMLFVSIDVSLSYVWTI